MCPGAECWVVGLGRTEDGVHDLIELLLVLDTRDVGGEAWVVGEGGVEQHDGAELLEFALVLDGDEERRARGLVHAVWMDRRVAAGRHTAPLSEGAVSFGSAKWSRDGCGGWVTPSFGGSRRSGQTRWTRNLGREPDRKT